MSRAVRSARRVAGPLSPKGPAPVGLGLAGLALAGLALAGCSAGQITQTSNQVTTVDGASGQIGPISLADITLSYPDSGEWSEGSSPELQFTITSTSLQADTLESVSSDAADRGMINTSPTGATTTPEATSAESTPTTDTGPEAAETSDAPGSGVASGASGTLEVPAQGLIRVPNDEVEVTLEGLTEKLLPTQSIPVTFTFAQAGEVTISVPVANPAEVEERGEEFDFHGEEHAAP